MFLLNQVIVSPIVHIFDIISLFAPELEEPKIGISGKGLTSRFLFLMTLRIKLFEKNMGKRENTDNQLYSSTGQRPASYCHGVVDVMRWSVRACVHKLFLQKAS